MTSGPTARMSLAHASVDREHDLRRDGRTRLLDRTARDRRGNVLPGEGRQRNVPAAGVDLVTAARLVPLRERRGLKHLLDDLPPADTGVVCAEGDLPHLGRVRDDAHLRAAEIVVEEILEPHSADEEDAPGVAVLPRESELAAGVAVHDLCELPR